MEYINQKFIKYLKNEKNGKNKIASENLKKFNNIILSIIEDIISGKNDQIPIITDCLIIYK